MTTPSTPPTRVSIQETSNIVQVDQTTIPPTRVNVEELRNVISVNQEAPNNVKVSLNNLTAQTSLLYSDGPPWTVVIDVSG